MKKLFLTFLAVAAIAFSSCDNDDDSPEVVVSAGTLEGGPFTFTVDGVTDNVSGVSVSGNPVGTNSSFIVTDESANILGLPPTLEALEGVDFDAAGTGLCLIWYIRYENDLDGLEIGNNAATDLRGTFDLSNSIEVNRVAVEVSAGTLVGGPFTFTAGDGVDDFVSNIEVTGEVAGSNSSFVVTDAEANILGLPPTIEALEGSVNLDGAGVGVCLIWYIRYEDDLAGLEVGNNAADLMGTFDLSNSITVNRLPNGGMLSGGPYTFTAGDGMDDFVSNVSVSDNLSGTNSTFVVTDATGLILGLPPTLEALGGVNFDGAGAGECLIWHLSYEDDIDGLETGKNALTDLTGTFGLSSNSISVLRQGVTLSGGPFTFTAGDGMGDFVSGITSAMTGSPVGSNSSFIVTDEAGMILGLPGDLAALEGVDFDGAGTGVCLIWYIGYEDGLMGLAMGNNATTDLSGTYFLSNSITVNRVSN